MSKDSILAGFGTLCRFAPCPSGHITADKRLTSFAQMHHTSQSPRTLGERPGDNIILN